MQVYLKNLTTGAVTLESVTPDGVVPGANVVDNAFTGNKIFFSTAAVGLDPSVTTEGWHTYVKDLNTGAITLLPHMANASSISVSHDGSMIAFMMAPAR